MNSEFAFHRLDPYCSGVKCFCTFYYRTYACNSFLEFFFPTPFHIGTWNFLWGFSELRYTSSLHFIVIPLMGAELGALACTFYQRTYACISFPEGFVSKPFHVGIQNILLGFSELRYTSSSNFIVMTLMVPELSALVLFIVGHIYVTVFRRFVSTSFHIGTWNFLWGFS
jgi:hypothetical protein